MRLRFSPHPAITYLGRMPRLRQLSVSFALTVALFGVGSTAWAGPAKSRDRAVQMVEDVERSTAKLGTPASAQKKWQPAALIAAADLHLRTGQYDAAIDKLNLVIEIQSAGGTSLGTDADAHYLLGEAYFKTGELYSARRHFNVVAQRAEEPAYAALGGPAASRLVDITLRIQRTEDLPDVLSQVDRMLARSSSESLRYARAKALFAIGRFDDAIAEAANISTGSLYAQRAAYLRGTALMRRAQLAAAGQTPAEDAAPSKVDYRQALNAFELSAIPNTRVAAEQAMAGEVTDLSWLAIARLHYETGDFDRASTYYQKIGRSSVYFAESLFELAWTNVRLGRYTLAQRALEALSVLNPGLLDGADGELLRADLLLREGKFQKAQEAYESVKNKFDPLRAQVASYLKQHEDPAVYYDKLTAAEIEVGHELPELAVDWAREAAEEERVFAIVDDVARSRKLIVRSRKIVSLLRATLGSDSRAKAFPEVLKQLESVVALLNQLGVARLTLARGMDEVAVSGSPNLDKVRADRRKLMPRLGEIPTNPGDFTVRDAQAEKSWNSVSQMLQRLQLQADHLHALVNGLRRVLDDAEHYGVSVDESSSARFRQEIDENEKDLAVYTRRIEALRAQVEIGRVQSGFGDERFQEDERVRLSFRQLFGQEVQLASSSRAAAEASYSKSIAPILSRMVKTEGQLDSFITQLNSTILSKSEEMRVVLASEAKAIEMYASRLDSMDQHARLLVGEVAKNNFILAKERLKDVVMRADVGLVQQAWEVREEQKFRVFDLLRERAQEDRLINDELREVLDDSEDLQ